MDLTFFRHVCELVDLFFPGGSVLDPYFGTMSTAEAALKAQRKCVRIEQNSDCFGTALDMLCRVLHSAKGSSTDADDAGHVQVFSRTSDTDNHIVNENSS